MMTDNKTNTVRISDEQLVDYLLNLLPDTEHQQLQQSIDNDSELQSRLNAWQNALFLFHSDTEEQTPPQRVWNNVEKQLFADDIAQKEHRWWQLSLRPAMLSLCLVAGIGFYVLRTPHYQPSANADYHAAVDARFFPITLWQVEGDTNSIAFTSIRNVSEAGRECVAWLQQGNSEPIRLGTIPDTGDKTLHRIQLPNQLKANIGDKIIVAMVDHGKTTLPPRSEQHIVTLNKI